MTSYNYKDSLKKMSTKKLKKLKEYHSKRLESEYYSMMIQYELNRRK